MILEEDDGNDGGNAQNPPPMAPPEDSDFTPTEHPWDYSDTAKIHISDLVLSPSEDKLKEFTKMPQGIMFEMVLGDTMVAMMDNYQTPSFNLAKYLLKTVDQRLRSHDGWLTKLATVLAGDEQKNGEDINPNSGPTL